MVSTRGDFVAEQLAEQGDRLVEFHPDPVDHPPHYTDGPGCQHCGKPVECITVTEKMSFNLGNAVKYIWRHDKKGNPVQDLKKARWYVDREIKRMGGE
jgi:hypothetical protein